MSMIQMAGELMRLSLYAFSAAIGGLGVLLVYVSCYAPSAALFLIPYTDASRKCRMYIVEIRRQSADLRVTMIQMRVQGHRVEPNSVELAFLRDRESPFRLQFETAGDAPPIARFF